MLLTTPQDQFETLKKKIEGTVKDYFPVGSKKSRLVLHGVSVDDKLDVNDLRSQRNAMKRKTTWAVPVYADLGLERDGKEIDRKRILLMHLPKMTKRYGYIIKGNEYQTLNQLRLKSGVYHRVARNGELLADFNLANPNQLAGGRTFSLNLKPEEGIFYLRHKNSEIPVYHLLRGAGVSDSDLEKRWGAEVLKKNKQRLGKDQAYTRFYKAVHGKKPASPEEHASLFGDLLKATQLREDTTKRTLGKAYSSVTPSALLQSTSNLLDISRGVKEADDKNALTYQSVHSFEDLLDGRLRKAASAVKRRILRRIDSKRSVRNVVNRDEFDKVINSFFQTSLVTQPEQVNPLEILAGRSKTTIMGEQGGIKSPHAISQDAKLINPSHLGFLDPIHTPEGEKTGVSLAFPLGVRKKGNTLVSLVQRPSTGERIRLTPEEMSEATVAFPDQYDRKDKKFSPRGDLIKATRGGEIVHVPPSEVEYVIPSPRALFGVASNLIPFLQNNQGNRAMTAARQQEQAVPLENREAPLVQVKTDQEKSFEEILGKYASATAPIEGKVVEIKHDAVVIKSGRKKHEVQFYRDFPLKGHTLYDSEVKVKVGDRVKKGQLLADSTFTREGKLALGTNLKTAYMPFHGYNFEDGIVISDDAAKKLTSLHLYEKDLEENLDTHIGKGKYLSQRPYEFIKGQIDKIGSDGVIKIGAEVSEGDPLILAVRKPSESKFRKQINAFRRGRPIKFSDAAIRWDKPTKGIVTDVYKRGSDVVVNVKTKEAAQIGDKIVGRHGNKGVITRIIPTSQMPYSLKEGEDRDHVDVLMNPLGVPGRINLGQILETVAGKIAAERGKVYKVRNFEPGKDYLESLKGELKAAGLQDKDVLINPTTEKPYGQKVLVGQQYILKLKHQVGKKVSARSGTGGPGSHYDVNHSPAGGAPHGGQTLGELGLYAMLAHGARENLHEMFAYKSGRNEDLWDAIREGTPLPPPKVPFAYDKFLNYLNAMRVNVKKEGNHLMLVPFTENQVQTLSSGELKDPGLVIRGKDNKPIPGGLFDEKITGGMDGRKWAHFKLAESMPNPLFEDAIKKLLGVTASRYKNIVKGEVEVNGKRGGAAIESMLKSVDVKKEIAEVETKLSTASKSGRPRLHARLRILKALDKNDLAPTVYMMKSVPVLPPIFRPLIAKEGGSLSSNDLNGLYKDLAAVNEALTTTKGLGITDKHLAELRGELYDGLKALTGLGGSLTRKEAGGYKGILDIISGKTRNPVHGDSTGGAKHGYFQKRLLKRRQDFSGRSIITPEPRMGIDELGLPEEMAWSIYRPFIERELVRQGYKMLDAGDEVTERSPVAEKALTRAMGDRPIFLKRDPALHKFNIMAFKPRLVKGKAIEIHPLVTGGYNADFDGDAMAVYLPIREKAVKEATKLFPSNNLFNPTTGAVMYMPGHESLLGLYLLSLPGKKTNKVYKGASDVLAAARRGDIKNTDIVKIGNTETTAGRLKLEAVLPKELQETGKRSVNKMRVFDKAYVKKVLTYVAKKHPKSFGEVVNPLKDIGNTYSTDLGFSIGLDDFSVINKSVRDGLMQKAEERASAIRKNTRFTQKTKDAKIVKIFQMVNAELDRLNNEHLQKNPTNISRMVTSGSRGKPVQLKQIVSSPVLVMDAKDRVVPYLIPRSYSEGMDIASYWTSLHGARKGTIQKVQGVRDPGYLSKQIMNSTMNMLVTEKDCKTSGGIWLDVDNADITDRKLAKGARLAGASYKAGSLVTPNMLAAAKGAKRKRLFVRSPLRCESDHGVCKTCMGLASGGSDHSIGDNVGIMAGQSIGEPATQLSMNVFHTGGLAKGLGAKSQGTFERLRNVLRLPKTVKDAAPLALTGGVVSKVQRAPQGGEYVTINKVTHYVPGNQKRTVKLRDTVDKGEPLSNGVIDPRDLLPLKGIESVQDYIASELQRVLSTAVPVRRRNVEVVVKSLTNVTHIDDPGTHPDWIIGDMRPTSVVKGWNKKTKGPPVLHTPVLKGVDILPLEMQEDWIARLNFQRLSSTLTQAAREGWSSNIHGFHPIPGIAKATEFGRGKKALGPEWKGQY